MKYDFFRTINKFCYEKTKLFYEYFCAMVVVCSPSFAVVLPLGDSSSFRPLTFSTQVRALAEPSPRCRKKSHDGSVAKHCTMTRCLGLVS